MAFRVRKIAGCNYSKDSREYRVALLEIQKLRKDFFAFALHLAVVSEGTFHLIYLEDRGGKGKNLIARYFSPEGGITKNFPRPDSDWWEGISNWLATVAEGEIDVWMKVKKPFSASRPRSGRPRVIARWWHKRGRARRAS